MIYHVLLCSFFVLLYCVIVCFALYYVADHCVMLCCIFLFFIMLCYVLCYIIWCFVLSCCIVSYCVVFFSVAYYRTLLCMLTYIDTYGYMLTWHSITQHIVRCLKNVSIYCNTTRCITRGKCLGLCLGVRRLVGMDSSFARMRIVSYVVWITSYVVWILINVVWIASFVVWIVSYVV